MLLLGLQFGKYIQAQQTEWGGQHYVNYKVLKKIINSVENLPISELLSSSSTSGQIDSTTPSSEFQALKTAFFFKLERELEKVC
jgi:CDK inhibitor PHO81